MMIDLIDRQAAINALENTECELLPEEWDDLTDAIMNLPSAEPFIIKMNRLVKADERERLEKELCRKMTRQNLILLGPEMELVYPKRKGKWVDARDGYDAHVKCTGCFKTYDWVSQAQYYNFCPNCGASMSEGEEDE